MKPLLKKIVARGIRRLPILNERYGIPRFLHQSTQAWCELHMSEGSRFIPLDPAFSRKIPYPATFESPIDTRFNLWLEETVPAGYVAQIPRGRFYHLSTIAPDHGLLADLSRLPDHERIRGKIPHPVLNTIRLPKEQKLSGTIGVTAMLGAHINYFHWMLEELPRFEMLRRAGFPVAQLDAVIVSSAEQPMQKESFDALGLDATKMVSCGADVHHRADLLLRPYLPSPYALQPWVLNFLRKTFLSENFLEMKTGAPIYITRRQARARRIVNEAEILELMKSKGFEILDLYGMTIKEQARRFATAPMIIGSHGAGMTNLAFCRPGCHVLEMFSPVYVDPSYYFISSLLDLDYHYIFGIGDIPSEVYQHPRIAPQSEVDASLEVPLDKLKRYIERYLKT